MLGNHALGLNPAGGPRSNRRLATPPVPVEIGASRPQRLHGALAAVILMLPWQAIDGIHKSPFLCQLCSEILHHVSFPSSVQESLTGEFRRLTRVTPAEHLNLKREEMVKRALRRTRIGFIA